MNFYSVLKFLEYAIFSSHKRGHSIHSPFVFDLITKVFRNKINISIVSKIEMIRKKLKSDNRLIPVTDFGIGSVQNKDKKSIVSNLVKKASVPEKYCRLLYRLSSEFGKSSVIEFGTSFGISAMYMAAANKEATVYTMEGCPVISEMANENFREAGLMNIRVLTGPFEKILPEIEQMGIRPGLVFIDGNHRKMPTLDYFNRMVSISDSSTVIIIDDIYYSYEMGEAWEEIKMDKRISATIDIYRMGIVFFREGMTRSDYKIRY